MAEENKTVNLYKIIDEFIRGDIKEKKFKNFNSYSVKESLEMTDKTKRYIYNEISFQHELGEYLRKRLGKNFRVQFERNIKDFNPKSIKNLRKREIDIVIVDENEQENEKYYIIELKYHKLGRKRYPNTMFDCVKDIDFVYNVINMDESKFIKGYCVTIVEDTTFYSPELKTKGDKLYNNYWCFREMERIEKGKFEVVKSESNKITKPIQIKDYVDRYHYLPIREKSENQKKCTEWKKLYDERISNVENIDTRNARYYIIEIAK